MNQGNSPPREPVRLGCVTPSRSEKNSPPKIANRVSLSSLERSKSRLIISEKLSLKSKVNQTKAEAAPNSHPIAGRVQRCLSLNKAHKKDGSVRNKIPAKQILKEGGAQLKSGLQNDNSATASVTCAGVCVEHQWPKPPPSTGLSGKPTVKSSLASLKFGLSKGRNTPKPVRFSVVAEPKGDSLSGVQALLRTSSRILEHKLPKAIDSNLEYSHGKKSMSKRNLESLTNPKLRASQDEEVRPVFYDLLSNNSQSVKFSKKSMGKPKHSEALCSLGDQQSKLLEDELDKNSSKYPSSKMIDDQNCQVADRFFFKMPSKAQCHVATVSEHTIVTFNGKKGVPKPPPGFKPLTEQGYSKVTVSLRRLGYTNSSKWIDPGGNSDAIIEQFKTIL